MVAIEYVISKAVLGMDILKGCAFCIADKARKKRRPAQNTDVVGNSPKKHKAEPATAPPEKRLESPKISVDPPSVDTIVLGSESGSRLMTI